jgi:hypothetical protein
MDSFEEYWSHRAFLNHTFDSDEGFSQEYFRLEPITPFFIDQAQTFETIRVVGLREREFSESFLGLIEFPVAEKVESLIPPFEIIFFLEGADVWILFPELLNVL